MKWIRIAFLGGILAACAPEPPVTPPTEVFRDTGAQIASQTNVTAQNMAGPWFVRQRFSGGTAIPASFELGVLPNGDLQMRVKVGVLNDDGKDRVDDRLVLLGATGPGRWTPVDPPRGLIEREIWVMWMDFDSRTAAIGTPSGEFGWIMDRAETGGSDRITAARDIMDWFGYDVDRLAKVQ